MTNLSCKKQKKKSVRRRLLAGQVSEKVTDVAKFENLQLPAFKDLSQNKGENQNIVKKHLFVSKPYLKTTFSINNMGHAYVFRHYYWNISITSELIIMITCRVRCRLINYLIFPLLSSKKRKIVIQVWKFSFYF